MARSRKMNRSMNKRSVRRSRNSRRTVKRAPMRKVGDASKVSFAAKLGAFVCQNQSLKDVVGDVNGFEERVKGRAVNQKVFGVLPFLHLNISREQFKRVLTSSSGNLVSAVEKVCNAKKLNKTLKSVDFNCHKQSVKGVNAGVIDAVMESIENRWNVRQNGRRVLNKVQAVQVAQVKAGKIPAASVAWCRC
jgi:hypothetical protein